MKRGYRREVDCRGPVRRGSVRVGHFVESRMGASTDAEATPRFPSPLIKPDVRIARIRLSDWLHRRLTNVAPTELDESAVLPVRRTPLLWRSGWCRGYAPDGAAAGSAVRSHRRSYEPP